MPNRLADETSPYLLQHAHNPVDWYPWGSEALERSAQEQLPIFLSIGYSACHWCHVMERESFEDAGIAQLLNENFVCIKVDREERPDLDHIYMQAVQAMTGRGGWPMSVFLTPDLDPFYGGTYWPPRSKMNMPGFDQVLGAVHDAWQNRREQAKKQAKQLTQHIAMGANLHGDGQLTPSLLEQAVVELRKEFDYTHGGFGDAPKFPHPMSLQLLLRIWSRQGSQDCIDMVRLNLDKMSRGGIYDHLGGGFARYSVDQRWLVPHFEKMLYDNALLADAYLDSYLVTRDLQHARVVRETLDYVLGYMTDEVGGFHSTEDADSEGEEGKFYVWTPEQIRDVLSETVAERFCYVYDVTDGGNFEGKSILNLPKTLEQCARIKSWDADQLQAEMSEARQKLLQARDTRVRPGKDDKILVSWNGLMIHTMARAGAVLQETSYIESAARAARFLLENLRSSDGRLLHCWRKGRARFDAYLDDYSCLANSFVSLYEATFDESWIDEAVSLAETMIQRFHDSANGGFFFTADDHETLIVRTKDLQDSAVPSGNAMAATVLLRLGNLCDRRDFIEAAEGTLRATVELMQRFPNAMGQMLIALDMAVGPTQQVVILGDRHDSQDVIDQYWTQYLPNCVVATRGPTVKDVSPHLEPLFSAKQLQNESPSLFVCEDFTCHQPACGRDAALARLSQLGRSLARGG